MKKAIINVVKRSTDTWENTEVRLFGLLVLKKHETFPDDRPRKIGFDLNTAQRPNMGLLYEDNEE